MGTQWHWARPGAGGRTKPTQLSVFDPSLTVEDKVVPVAGDDFDVSVEGREERSRGSYE